MQREIIQKLMWIKDGNCYIAFDVLFDGKHSPYEYIKWRARLISEKETAIENVCDDFVPEIFY